MKKETKYKIWINVLAILIVLLCGALCYVACIKTDFSKRMIAILYRTPYVPERRDADCVASWNNSVQKLEMQFDIVFFGDSHTARGNFQKAFPNVKSINLGYIGEDVKGMLRRVEAIAAVQPKKIFLMAGINGLKKQSLSEFEYWYAGLVDSIRSAMPAVEMYVESILPITASSDYCDNQKIRDANAVIENIAQARHIKYIDLYNAYNVDGSLPEGMSCDGLHITYEAYSIWYNLLKECIIYD